MKPLVSVVMPCFNEAEAVGECVAAAKMALERAGVSHEIIVCDNDSNDESAAIAASFGAVVVREEQRGYGLAYLAAFRHARGQYWIMADADGTYDLSIIPEFLKKLKEGDDFVSGTRFNNGARPPIPYLNRALGNPVLTFLVNLLFGSRYSDVYTGYRAFSGESYARIQPSSPGMEFNLELAVRAAHQKLRSSEIPINLKARLGRSKLRPWRDGLRSICKIFTLFAEARVLRKR
jgi:glycosyltransferase involved in cell wall biosynthesis